KLGLGKRSLARRSLRFALRVGQVFNLPSLRYFRFSVREGEAPTERHRLGRSPIRFAACGLLNERVVGFQVEISEDDLAFPTRFVNGPSGREDAVVRLRRRFSRGVGQTLRLPLESVNARRPDREIRPP